MSYNYLVTTNVPFLDEVLPSIVGVYETPEPITPDMYDDLDLGDVRLMAVTPQGAELYVLLSEQSDISGLVPLESWESIYHKLYAA